MFVIGLTGPTGAGKGTVGQFFTELGCPVLDADAVYRKLLIPPSECLKELTAVFGTAVLNGDGTLNRKALASIVFSDAERLATLNRIAHAHVMREIRRQIRLLEQIGYPAAVMDAPQLFEANAEGDCNLIVSVLAAPEIRLKRIMKRDSLSQEAALARMQVQKSDAFFRERSDVIIENNGSTDGMKEQIQKILARHGVLLPQN